MDEKYLNLFKNQQEANQNEWENINETPDYSSYNDDVNETFDNFDFQIETKINGVNVSPTQQLTPNSRNFNINSKNLNGLDQFSDKDDLRENYRYKQQHNIQKTENINDVGVVSVEMFEKIITNTFLTLVNKS